MTGYRRFPRAAAGSQAHAEHDITARGWPPEGCHDRVGMVSPPG